MDQPNCSCAQLKRLEGASIPAYIKAFLEPAGSSSSDTITTEEKNRYRCRVCGRVWEKRAPATKGEGTRAALVRVS